ncbi:tripartite motif-containing protein 5 [Engraulis encrasicolus]|uniref:tripartite motif-containing protein 5 n=1 Tax=Engraulis encrasicolus TaxID=184585 RepID=UPI002FD5FA56
MSTNPAAVKQEQEELQLSSSSSVLCDMCLDRQTPALKTCLKCEISMCAQHLQAHLTTPVLLQTHPLTKPMPAGGLSSGAVARCPEHGKLLEYYCLDDRLCVCVSCSIEDQHRLHNLKTLAGAQKVLVEKLKEEKKELAERQVQGIALKSWETKQKKDLEVSSERLQNAVVALRDIGLTKVGSSVLARLEAVHAAQKSIEAALSEEDAHLFLQGFGDVYEAVEKAQAVDFIHGLEETAKPEQVVFDLLKNGHETVQRVLKLQGDLLTLVDPDKQFWGTDKPTDMTFDEETVGQLLVSTDLKTLSCCSPTVSQTVYFKNSIDSDLHWTMVFSEKYNWSVGLCCGPQHDHRYGLEWKDKKLFAHKPQESSALEDMIFENKVEVCWDSSGKSLCFFTRGEYGQLIGLYSVDIKRTPKQSLRPFVTLVKKQDTPSGSGTASSNCDRCGRCSSYGGCNCRPKYADIACQVHGLEEYDPPSKKRKRV